MLSRNNQNIFKFSDRKLKYVPFDKEITIFPGDFLNKSMNLFSTYKGMKFFFKVKGVGCVKESCYNVKMLI